MIDYLAVATEWADKFDARLKNEYSALYVEFEPGDMTSYRMMISRQSRHNWSAALLTCGGGTAYGIDPERLDEQHYADWLGREMGLTNPCTQAAVAAMLIAVWREIDVFGGAG